MIDRYIQAQCIPFTTEPGRFRAWDHTLQISGDRIARVAGQQTPGGRIEVRFEPEYEPSVAANAGDYIYPSDVRVATDDRLYVRADGRRAAFGGQQTWLFEYDLQKRRRTMRARIDPNILPALCPPKQ